MKFIVLLMLLMSISGCHKKCKKTDNEVMIFAGVGMKNAVTEIIDSFSTVYPKIKILSNWAPSGVLAKQIAQGQIPDVFISANQKWTHYVDSLACIIDGKTMPIANNEIVLVVPRDAAVDSITFNSSLDLLGLLKGGLLSIGDPAFVPVGNYAKQALEYYQLYPQVAAQLVPARDVRSTLWVLELGEAAAGIVFRSEANNSKKVKTIALIPPESHKAITFLASQCKNTAEASLFYNFLNSTKARNIWVKHGFY